MLKLILLVLSVLQLKVKLSPLFHQLSEGSLNFTMHRRILRRSFCLQDGTLRLQHLLRRRCCLCLKDLSL